MAHFLDLQRLAEEVSLWADLRHEQGADVSGAVEGTVKALKHARRELRKWDAGAEKEPDDLEGIRAQRPDGARRLWESLQSGGLKDRVRGAWLGRVAGCTLGAPVENWSVADMALLAARSGAPFPPEDYWADHPWPEQVRYGMDGNGAYLKGRIRYVPVDDDVAYTLLGLLILEEYGPDFWTEDVAAAWVKYLPVAYTAERVTLENLRDGEPVETAGVKRNPYMEWIGAAIRADAWGYAAAGWPEKAAELAWRDGRLSHRRNGVYGEMFFAASIAAAFAVDDPVEALRVGLTEIPAECRLAADVWWALETGAQLTDWRDARAAVDMRFGGMNSVHTNNNACLTVFGLMLGGGDFTKTIGWTVAMGLDNDCTAATAGSIFGAALGAKKIPAHWWKPFRNRARTYMVGQEWFANVEVVERFLTAAVRVWSGERE
jgi:ADP-ribosylglycohydrolase